MSMTILGFVLAAAAVYASPLPQEELPQTESNSTSCGAYEAWNPYLNECVGYASPSSCGLLGVACASGEWCSNANDLSNPGGRIINCPS